MDWWDVLKIPRESTLEQINAAYTKACSSVGDGEPELHDNKVQMTHETYMRLMNDLSVIGMAYKIALNEVKK